MFKIMSFGDMHTIVYDEKHVELVNEKAGLDGGSIAYYVVNRACIVRDWGAPKGLGQLATRGPQKETHLDAICDGIQIPVCNVYGIWTCNEQHADVWRKQIDAAEIEMLGGQKKK